ncbi:hypothetical protein CKAN_01308700 [Cinnamomum micranthum f. kanehirae]|uniref:Uncharacterized protein n=1 Tax=Cinnamomum micranthum f. kanehirae TaxID=337451 RepID=A0A3S3MQI7_9MAGN|nr:hypothetical protein CKAN_01308700 [Cinnamomum micranthum f. kanehirae]
MSRSSEYHLGAASSLPPFRQFGEYSEEEECDVIAKKKKKATIEQQQQQQKGMVCVEFLNAPSQLHNYFGIFVYRLEYIIMMAAVLGREEGTPMQSQHNNLGSKKEEVAIQGRKEEEHVIQVEPELDAPVAAQSSLNHSGSMAHSESEIMSYAVPVRLNS